MVMDEIDVKGIHDLLKNKLNAWFVFSVSHYEDSCTLVRYFYIFKDDELFCTNCKDSHSELLRQDINQILLDGVRKDNISFVLDYERISIIRILNKLRKESMEEYEKLVQFFSLSVDEIESCDI